MTIVVTWMLALMMTGPWAAHAGQQQRPQESRSPHGPLNMACDNCHTFTGWKPIRSKPEFDHNKTSFPLLGMHQKVACMQCHTSPIFSNAGTKCADCHADIHKGQFGANCEQCHTVKGWQVSIQQTREHFNRFPLIGAHAVLECDSCHKGAAVGQFRGLSTDCFSCHAQSYAQTTAPNHKAAGFGTDCRTCHTSIDSWFTASFDHLKFTGFALTGAHATLECTACHIGGKFQGTSADCFSCHAKDYNGTNNPNHAAAGIPTTCQTCHSTTAWQPASFNHNLTKFPLTGAHVKVDCATCHVGGNYSAISTDCSSCHLKDYQGAKNPDHVAAGMPTTCQVCHSTTAWQPANFDHNQTKFPLTGAHVSVACASCHVGGNYSAISTDCSSCHMKDYQGTTNPNHAASGIPTTCQVCHSTTAWQPATFDHSKTKFPLTGAHVNVACTSCHVGGNYSAISTDCSSCHLKDYQGAKNPDHVAAGFPTTCQTCHTTTAWQPATFDHNTTKFPLTGAHVNVACANCHVNGNYTTLSTDCSSCHMKDYTGAKNPDHVASMFPTTCQTCHSTAAWSPATFDHNTYTKFPLTGAHVSVACTSCHVNGNYTTTPTDCYSCHKTDYAGTTNPNHAAAGFPTDCSVCHSTTSWAGATFDHSTTGFPLTGAHVSVACASCHVNGNYSLSSTACSSCHTNDYNGTTNPNHKTAGFPMDCTLCHTTAAWQPSTFNHNNTPFPLTGAHVNVACASCHINGNYTTVPTDCYSCHKSDYTGTTNPNHAAAMFPTTCGTCHTTTAWTGATFNHTWFPIYSGTHAGRWTTCADCHTDASNYAIFSCITCHQHSQANTDGNHRGVRNYVYNATSCYSCHPTGNGG